MPDKTPSVFYEEPGVVKEIFEDKAEVELIPSDSCRHCGAAHLCNWSCTRTQKIVARNPIAARPGDKVFVRREEKERLRLSLLTFGLPALLMVAGVAIGTIFLNDLGAALLAGIGLLLAILILQFFESHRAHSGRSLPVIVRSAQENQTQGGFNEENFNHNACDAGCPDNRPGG
ncbi:MAG: SoxR reducing system RseC family protein [bacterium]